MAKYVEIEDPRELQKLNQILAQKLQKALKFREQRKIGSPAGTFWARVHFCSDASKNTFWWVELRDTKRGLGKNLFGHGIPHRHNSLNMDVQFNVPVVDFSRTSGGAFLRHLRTNRVVLAHRGLVTIGHGRVPKSVLLAKMNVARTQAATSTGMRDFLLIGELKSPRLINKISDFATQVRHIVRSIRRRNPRETRNRASSKTLGRITRFGKLGRYFREFSGQLQIKGRRQTVANYYHGNVVEALRKKLDGSEVYKNQQVDLVVGLKSGDPYLFEIKTSFDTQSIYTAIGQLMIHAPRVAQDFPRRRLRKVIVLPQLPSEQICKTLSHKLNISLLTFTLLADSKIRFASLDKLA
jgi:hypothetical protein